jgi:hypothetical protein
MKNAHTYTHTQHGIYFLILRTDTLKYMDIGLQRLNTHIFSIVKIFS